MKICFIPAYKYPVPAVKGGAVEGLIETLIKENEKKQLLDITVASVYNEDAQEIAKSYKKTKIVFVKYGNILDKIQENKMFIYINRLWMKFFSVPLINRNYVKRLYKAIKNEEYDAYIVEGGGDAYNYKYLMKKIEHEKMWVHMHADIPGDTSLKKMFSKFICVSNYVARVLVMNGNIDRDCVYVLPNCVDMNAFSVKEGFLPSQIRNSLGLKEKDFVFVFWGRLLPEKGIKELVGAFSKFQEKHEEAKLLIIGNPTFGYKVDTEYTQSVKREMSNKKLDGKIVFTGFIDHSQLWKYIRSSDVAVIPSVWNDAAPLVVFEGFASEIPLITTRVGGIGEVANESNCLLIDWKVNFEEQLLNNMEKAYFNMSQMKELSIKAYSDVQNYTSQNYYDNFVNILKQGLL